MTHEGDSEYLERSYFESLRRAQIASDRRLAAIYRDFAGKYARAFREETGIALGPNC